MTPKTGRSIGIFKPVNLIILLIVLRPVTGFRLKNSAARTSSLWEKNLNLRYLLNKLLYSSKSVGKVSEFSNTFLIFPKASYAATSLITSSSSINFRYLGKSFMSLVAAFSLASLSSTNFCNFFSSDKNWLGIASGKIIM